jgi:hypothetical protein
MVAPAKARNAQCHANGGVSSMSRAAVLIACAVPLAACNSEPEVNARNASVAEVADKVAKAADGGTFVRPGKWRSTVTVDQLAVPGMPPELAERMKAAMAQRTPTQTDSCLTPEDAKRPKEDFFGGADKSCRYDRFTMAAGKIDAVMKCSAGGASQTMTMNGTYSPDDYRMRMTVDAAQGGSATERGMNMTMRVEAKRIGACDAKPS